MKRLLLAMALSLTVAPSSALAAGAILVDTSATGDPVLWLDDYVNYNPETTTGGSGGELGRLSNAEALALVRELFADWLAVAISGESTVSLTIEERAGLGDIDTSNVDSHFTYCPPDSVCTSELAPFVVGSARSGQSPIIFDKDGSITDMIQGAGASEDILGFAGPRVVDRSGVSLYITEAQAVLNGSFIDCAVGAPTTDPCRVNEVTLEEFKGAIFHELGHFLGLDHTQVNLSSVVKSLQGDNSEAEYIPTMLPLFVDGEAQRTPHHDDAVALSMLYPSSAFQSNFCQIQGKVFASDGVTELQGVNVVVRDVDDPLGTASSFVSGSYYTGSADCTAEVGDYQILGVAPGRDFTLEIEPISQAFRGGSSIEPCDPPLSGFDKQQVSGTFSCDNAGEVITVGTVASTEIVSSKEQSTTSTPTDDEPSTPSASSGGGCSLIRTDRFR